jgi:hypothetical protein
MRVGARSSWTEKRSHPLQQVNVVLILSLLALKLGAHLDTSAEEIGGLIQAHGLEGVGYESSLDVASTLSFS